MTTPITPATEPHAGSGCSIERGTVLRSAHTVSTGGLSYHWGWGAGGLITHHAPKSKRQPKQCLDRGERPARQACSLKCARQSCSFRCKLSSIVAQTNTALQHQAPLDRVHEMNWGTLRFVLSRCRPHHCHCHTRQSPCCSPDHQVCSCHRHTTSVSQVRSDESDHISCFSNSRM